MTIKNIFAIALAFSLIACSCGNRATKNTTTTPVTYQKISPDFNGDSAYVYVDKQVAFGPRVPNTAAHVACGDYLTGELKRFGADVTEQKMTVTAYNGTKLNARNIIGGAYVPDKKTVCCFSLTGIAVLIQIMILIRLIIRSHYWEQMTGGPAE